VFQHAAYEKTPTHIDLARSCWSTVHWRVWQIEPSSLRPLNHNDRRHDLGICHLSTSEPATGIARGHSRTSVAREARALARIRRHNGEYRRFFPVRTHPASRIGPTSPEACCTDREPTSRRQRHRRLHVFPAPDDLTRGGREDVGAGRSFVYGRTPSVPGALSVLT
jgi:hypothetical protein